MFGINLNAVSLISTVALGPVGGLGMQLATQVFANMGQQILQGMGERMNLGQSAIDLALDSFTSSSGGVRASGDFSGSIGEFGSYLGGSPAQIGEQERNTLDFVNNTIRQAGESSEFSEARSSGKGGGWLMAMAKALGAQLDQLGDEMSRTAGQITKDTPSLSAEFGVMTQQFSMLMNAATNSIKTAGEAMAKAAGRN
ncbi:hypothetical protein KCP91_02700 [Microvirga sp. SRT01]|uniref:Uncharacterized protein n=1 Tax=Sphingomonas longa TaxID=2778730 RepID=A0ABS2D2X8_9SPHN|nr:MULTISPECIES: hypothetical protein [Alphaproteobacteria]MBM6575265.1 hypothetical protein [Sphingomonas sp. BT552]MBR7708315.1 hypothetical protein [Microvirga sp. SRT01]